MRLQDHTEELVTLATGAESLTRGKVDRLESGSTPDTQVRAKEISPSKQLFPKVMF